MQQYRLRKQKEIQYNMHSVIRHTAVGLIRRKEMILNTAGYRQQKHHSNLYQKADFNPFSACIIIIIAFSFSHDEKIIQNNAYQPEKQKQLFLADMQISFQKKQIFANEKQTDNMTVMIIFFLSFIIDFFAFLTDFAFRTVFQTFDIGTMHENYHKRHDAQKSEMQKYLIQREFLPVNVIQKILC